MFWRRFRPCLSFSIHGDFRSLVSNYGLKWNVRNDDLLIERFTKKNDVEAIFNWVKLVKTECPELSDFMDFMAVTGLRFGEAVESYNLIVQLAHEGKLGQYYNEEKAILEHYRFKGIFLRRTKKAFISFVPKELIQKLGGHESLNIHSVQTRVKRRCKKLAFSDIRELMRHF